MEDFIKFVLSSHKTWTYYKNIGEFLSENISCHCYGLVQWRLSKGLHLVNVFCQYCNGWLLRSSNIWSEYTAVVVNEWAIWSALWNRPGFIAHSIFPLLVIFVLMNLNVKFVVEVKKVSSKSSKTWHLHNLFFFFLFLS